MTAQANVTAILATLTTALAPRKVYELGTVPSPRPPQYVEVTLSRRFGGSQRLSSQIATTGYRLTVAAVSQSTVGSIRSDLEKCRAALEFNRLSVGGQQTTPIQFETDDEADYGAGWFSEYMAFTYAIRA